MNSVAFDRLRSITRTRFEEAETWYDDLALAYAEWHQCAVYHPEDFDAVLEWGKDAEPELYALVVHAISSFEVLNEAIKLVRSGVLGIRCKGHDVVFFGKLDTPPRLFDPETGEPTEGGAS